MVPSVTTRESDRSSNDIASSNSEAQAENNPSMAVTGRLPALPGIQRSGVGGKVLQITASDRSETTTAFRRSEAVSGIGVDGSRGRESTLLNPGCDCCTVNAHLIEPRAASRKKLVASINCVNNDDRCALESPFAKSPVQPS